MTEPHWERGYRCFGFWLGEERIGFVGRPPGRSAPYYSWIFEPPQGCLISNRAATLRAAKRAVEKLWEQYRPDVRG